MKFTDLLKTDKEKIVFPNSFKQIEDNDLGPQYVLIINEKHVLSVIVRKHYFSDEKRIYDVFNINALDSFVGLITIEQLNEYLNETFNNKDI